MSLSWDANKANSTRLVDERAIENGDPCFTLAQLQRFDYQLLRRLAAVSNTDAINGKSNRLEMQEYFRCQFDLTEFE